MALVTPTRGNSHTHSAYPTAPNAIQDTQVLTVTTLPDIGNQMRTVGCKWQENSITNGNNRSQFDTQYGQFRIGVVVYNSPSATPESIY
jgi:hypothetical protein